MATSDRRGLVCWRRQAGTKTWSAPQQHFCVSFCISTAHTAHSSTKKKMNFFYRLSVSRLINISRDTTGRHRATLRRKPPCFAHDVDLQCHGWFWNELLVNTVAPPHGGVATLRAHIFVCFRTCDLLAQMSVGAALWPTGKHL